MRFRRNLFFPIRLILYPILLEIILVLNGAITSDWFWTFYSLVSILLLVEAIWEFVVPYAILDGDVLEINSSLISKKRIDLPGYSSNDINIGRWEIQIGNQNINLRKVRAGYRDRLAELIQNYFALPG